jgi:hypothetical protein
VVEGFVAGSVFGVVVGLLIARLWRKPDTTPTGMDADEVPPGDSVSPVQQSRDDQGHLHLRREVVRKTEAKLTPDGLSVTVDGQEFHRLEDIPDRAVADRMRELLASTAASTTDPTLRAKVEQELRDAGIEPTPGDQAST